MQINLSKIDEIFLFACHYGSYLRFLIRTILAFSDYMSPWCCSQLAFRFQEQKQKIDFQDVHHGGHLGFPIGRILAIFDLQVTLMLPTLFQVKWPFVSGEAAKNRFSIWQPAWISKLKEFSHFLSTSHPDASYQVSIGLLVQEKKKKKNRFSRWLSQCQSWISDKNNFSYFWSTSHLDASYRVSSQFAFCFIRSEK